jgi:arylsulfatase A-like enzyme
MPRIIQIFVVVTTAAYFSEPTHVASAEHPNIVIILADDLGYGDVRCYQPESKIATPNMDRIAEEGVRFTDAHSPSSVCTPTRYALLTGRYCWRTRLKRGVLMGYSGPLIEPGRMTIPSLLKQHGYSTGVVGKWHLGLAWQKQGDQVDFSRPVTAGAHTVGFDYSYIVPASLDMAPYVYVENGRATQRPTREHAAEGFPRYTRRGVQADDFDFENCLDHLTEKAIEYIAERADCDAPFLLYFPLTAPHKPCWPHPRFQGSTAIGPYGDFVQQVDWTVGQILEVLDKAEVAENTLLIVTSDNGSYMYRWDDERRDHVDDPSLQGYRAARHRANGPLRGTKTDIWEAGHRVPFLVRWPKAVEQGRTCETPICLTDVMATCATIVKHALPPDAGEDSFSLLPLLTNKPDDFQRAPVIHHSANGMFAIRQQQWKLVLGNGSGGREQPSGKPFVRPYALFDLKTDLAESTDLAGQHPDVARKLGASCNLIREAGRSRHTSAAK